MCREVKGQVMCFFKLQKGAVKMRYAREMRQAYNIAGSAWIRTASACEDRDIVYCKMIARSRRREAHSMSTMHRGAAQITSVSHPGQLLPTSACPYHATRCAAVWPLSSRTSMAAGSDSSDMRISCKAREQELVRVSRK